MVQVGLTLFEEESPGKFTCRPFNVFVFPRAFEERDLEGHQVKSDQFIGLNASTADFLVGNGLNFHRWVAKGVSYVDAELEAALRKGIPEPEQAAEPLRPEKERLEPTKPTDVKLVQDTMKQIGAFATSEQKEMKLPHVNSFLALILRQRIAENHPDISVEKRQNGNNSHHQERWLVKLSQDEKLQRSTEVRDRIFKHIGFRRMWTSLKASRKPVVFHNGFMDLMFLANSLERRPDKELKDFKALIHEALPLIFDTKVLAESSELSGKLGSRSALPELAASLKNVLGGDAAGDGEVVPLSFTFPEGFRAYEGEVAAFHNAGYDSLETGRIFAFYRHCLGDERLKPFANRLYLMYSAFQLQFGADDALVQEGILRCLAEVDTVLLNNWGFSELLKPLLQDGKRQLLFKWCADGTSLLLLLHGPDIGLGTPERQACEECLDVQLGKQAELKRLKILSMQEHTEKQLLHMHSEEAPETFTNLLGVGRPAKKRRHG